MLKKAGFDSVDLRSDLKAVEMRRALREFGNKTRDADVAVVYYAGHGIELDNANYLIPVDTLLETDTDIYDETTPLDRVLVAVEPAKQLRLIILDACRDNPFSKSMKRTVASRAIGRGLAKVEPTSPNTIIAFAAKAGFTASDGDGKNSPFALALAKHLATPGLDLRKAFGFVRDDVLKATGNKQEPYIYGSLGGDDVSLVPPKPAGPPPASPQADMRRDYELALQIGTRAVWASFLNTYPSGFYADLAKGQVDRIAAEEARVAAVEKARLVQEEKVRLATESTRQAEQTRVAAQARKAEEAVTAAEKEKQAELAKATAAEKAAAEKADAMKAEADAAAERRRQAADVAKQAEHAKVAAAEQARVAAEKATAEKAAALKAEADAAAERKRQTAEATKQAKAAAAEQARIAAEKAAAEKVAAAKAEADAVAEANRQVLNAPAGDIAPEAKAQEPKASEPGTLVPVRVPAQTQLALLTPPSDPVSAPKSASGTEALVRDIKKELQRVGCYSGVIDEKWVTAKASLGKFAKFASLSAMPEQPDSNLLENIRGRSGRICPLECSVRQTESNGRCIVKTCPSGSVLNGQGSCEKHRDRTAARPSSADTPALESGSGRAGPSSRAALGDATKESMTIMPPGTIRTGHTMTLTARNGRKMICTGGSQHGVRRTCVWN
ncbi:MAG: hypothetical protein JWR80_6581 [Bradyrhizobium sp.]|nr:hypothetical protein [Bradyrhizobium sp.]